MSIRVRNISKSYNKQQVLKGISFDAKPGRILGFLGPNGAGKSTTMKIISGSLAPTSGEVSINGIPVATGNVSLRKHIGYLPENNPVYKDMYVREALSFIARLHRIDQAHKKIDDVIALTGLLPEQHKKMSQLSKGYRQRVGLAQAILHDPDVLILDEPTSGLDPNQLLEIRTLIKNLSTDKTVLFSTHIMQEVEAICDDVIIIQQGTIIADFPMNDLHARYGEEHLEKLFIRLTTSK